MLYSINDLQKLITPIAQKYQLRAVYIFGSYSRNEIHIGSDVDILVDTAGSVVRGLIIGGLYNDLCEAIGADIDMITVNALTQDREKDRMPGFAENVLRERVLIYEK
ncbi:MAG: nucleotidyltransferase domain-containing protein [Euryarchaeota archaeon]|nr:nucleotidyltransferase domain-containing protein [Euryarchaeota archaeon]